MANKLTPMIVLLVLLGAAGQALALDDPHATTNGIYCGQCHISHGALGDILVNATNSLVSTLCISCHSPGGWVPMSKEISSSQIADPGISGTSHAWDVAAENSQYGADLPQQTVLLDHLAADNSITCATCHDPHQNGNPPFLRLDNSADALCLDCHRVRDMGSVRTYTGNATSHPVGVTLPSTDTFHNPPLDVDGNPQPSDGIVSNDYLLNGGSLQCTSCHGVHYADSNSGTEDGP